MTIKKHIPNTLTLLNLLCGVIATIFAYNEYYMHAAVFFLSGVTFDFFDGFAARMLNVKSDVGKELDSLADCITSGLLPSMVMFTMMCSSLADINGDWVADWFPVSWAELASWTAFIIVMFSALRLAKFNLDTRQSESFIGLPTPACGLIVVFLPFLRGVDFMTDALNNYWVLLGITLLCSYLLVSEIHLFALKFKNFTWKDNREKWTLIAFSVLMIAVAGWKAFPVIILVYVAMSMIINSRKNVRDKK
ncbi:MAG: CDP-alcohol phosphatidyltransferase family protein [Flavobacteriales bacterium]|nr:CDP-alcohol phosphatidyltransferase family protein [Flavobacteriales bacterium]